MDKNILYIILGIAWFLFNTWVKKQNKQRKEAKEREESVPSRGYEPAEPKPREPQPASNFDDVLRELMGDDAPRPKPQPVRKEPVVVKTAPKVKVVKEKRQPLRSRMVSLEDDVEEMEVVEEATEATPLNQLFADRDSVVNAFVASEVLRRKY